MRNQRQDRFRLGAIIFTLLLAGGVTWAAYQYSMLPGVEDAFAPIWAAARQVVSDQTNPYDQDELRKYLPPGSPPDSRFVYPFYAMLLFLPFGLIPTYVMAKAIWMGLLMAALFTTIYGVLSLTSWDPSVNLLWVVVLFSLILYPAFRSLYSGNPAVILCLLIAAGLKMVIRGRDRAAGVLFGLTILKPTMVALLLPYVLLYAVSHRKTRLIRSALVTMIILVASAFFAYPGWFVQNFAQVVFLFKVSFPSSISAVAASWVPESKLMVVVAALVALWVVLAWWRSLGKDPRWFLWTVGLTLVLTEMIGIPTNTANYVVLIIPMIFTFSIVAQRWKVGGPSLVLMLMIFILLAGWVPYLVINGADTTLPEPKLMLFLLPMIVGGLLYWVRYWALTSVRMQVERFGSLRHL